LAGILNIFKKELSDHLSSKRFYILFFLIYALSIGTAWTSIPVVLEGVKRTGGEVLFLDLFTSSSPNVNLSFLQVVSFFFPIIGFMLTFESICGESLAGTLYVPISQPIHRDSLINAKFLAAISVIALSIAIPITSIVGIGMVVIRIAPSSVETIRLIVFWGFCVAYLSFWAALGLLFSTLLELPTTSVLASISVWFFFTIFIYTVGGLLESVGVPSQALLRASPSYLFTQASAVILVPLLRFVGPVSVEKFVGMLPSPLSLSQSLSIVIPQLIFFTSGTFPLFLLAYLKFTKQEVRA
jgi:ABC-2 type transport system permease protein